MGEVATGVMQLLTFVVRVVGGSLLVSHVVALEHSGGGKYS